MIHAAVILEGDIVFNRSLQRLGNRHREMMSVVCLHRKGLERTFAQLSPGSGQLDAKRQDGFFNGGAVGRLAHQAVHLSPKATQLAHGSQIFKRMEPIVEASKISLSFHQKRPFVRFVGNDIAMKRKHDAQ